MSPKSCFIPFCMNTSNNSDKIFVSVPKEAKRRKAWFESFSNQTKINTSTLYCCEDHFDLQKDAKNWWFYVSMGSKLILQEDVVPHKYLTLQEGNPPAGSQFTESARKRRLETQRKLENSRKRKREHEKLSSRSSSLESQDEYFIKSLEFVNNTDENSSDNQEIDFVEIKSEKMIYECDKCDYSTDFFTNYREHQDNCSVDIINKTEINNRCKRKTETENNISDIVIKEECQVSSTDDYDVMEQDRNLIGEVKTEQIDLKQEICEKVDQNGDDDVEVYIVIETKPEEPSQPDTLRLTGRHFPDMVIPDETNPYLTRMCVVCASQNPKSYHKKRSEYLCKICNVGLCVVPCFEIYHTQRCY